MRPFGYGLLISASVRTHRSSGHEADSYWTIFPITQAATTTMGITTKRIIVLFILVITYLFGRIGTTLEQLSEKSPHFCEDFFSLIYVWSGGRDSNSRHSAWKADALPTELPPLVERLSSRAIVNSHVIVLP